MTLLSPFSSRLIQVLKLIIFNTKIVMEVLVRIIYRQQLPQFVGVLASGVKFILAIYRLDKGRV